MTMTEMLSSRRRSEVLALMCGALAVVTAAFISLNVALPSFAQDTGATQTQLTWIVGAYGLVFAALLLPAGALADRIGRREVLVGGLAVFTVASLAAAFVSSPEAVIALRVVSAVGAAAVMPSTLSILISIFPEEERGRAVGAWAATAGGAGLLAIFAAGGLLEAFSWQSIFVLNAALGAPLLVAIARRVPTSRDPNPGPVDPVGVLLSVFGLGALVLAVVEGPERGWGSALVLGSFVASCVSLAGFILWELRTEHPLLDPRLFRSPSFAAGSFAITIQFFAIFAFQFVSLQYLQQVRGYSALGAGLALLPIGIILGALAPRAPQLAARFGMRTVVAIGSALLAVGLLILAQLQVDSAFGHFLVGTVVLGAGMALAAAPATEAILASLPASQQGLASAVNDTTRELGGALGIAILGSLLNLGYRATIDDRLTDAHVRAAARPSLEAAAQTAAGLGDRGAEVLNVAQTAFVHGLHIAFYSGAGAVLIGTLVFLRLAPRRAPRRPTVPVVDGAAPAVDGTAA